MTTRAKPVSHTKNKAAKTPFIDTQFKLAQNQANDTKSAVKKPDTDAPAPAPQAEIKVPKPLSTETPTASMSPKEKTFGETVLSYVPESVRDILPEFLGGNPVKSTPDIEREVVKRDEKHSQERNDRLLNAVGFTANVLTGGALTACATKNSNVNKTTQPIKPAIKQDKRVNEKDEKTIRDVLTRFNISPTDDELTYSEKDNYTQIPDDLKKRLGEDSESLKAVAGYTDADNNGGNVQAFVFKEAVKDQAKLFHNPAEDFQHYVIINEVGNKALYSHGIDEKKSELVTELMSAKSSKELAYKAHFVVMHRSYNSGEKFENYRLIDDAFEKATSQVMKRHGIGGAVDDHMNVQNEVMSVTRITEENARKTGKKIEYMDLMDDFIDSIARKANLPSESIRGELYEDYFSQLDKTAKP